MPARLASLLPPALVSALGVAAAPLVPPTTGIVQESALTEDAHVIQAAPVVHLAALVARQAAPSTYTVRPGDTLSAIAGRACGNPGDYWALALNNGVADPDRIFAGQVFKIACQAAAEAIARRYGLPGSPPVHYVSHGSGGGDGDGDSDDAGTVPAYHHSSGAVVTPAPGTYHGSGAMQQCIIARESGGNPRAVNPASGAGGLYQFLPSSWRALGYSGLPEDAPVSEQNQAFYKEVAQDGGYSAWTPYDGC